MQLLPTSTFATTVVAEIAVASAIAFTPCKSLFSSLVLLLLCSQLNGKQNVNIYK